MLDLILASSSPRRRELLRQIGVEFEVISSNVPEDFDESLSSIQVARILADRKASAVAAQKPNSLILAADTVIEVDNEILGKPESDQEAREMLMKLNGKTHKVITGVVLRCLNSNISEKTEVVTEVKFGKLTDEMIDWYVGTGEPIGKAGAYGIQGKGAVLVKEIKGSYSNVVGLPLFEVNMLLSRYMEEEEKPAPVVKKKTAVKSQVKPESKQPKENVVEDASEEEPAQSSESKRSGKKVGVFGKIKDSLGIMD